MSKEDENILLVEDDQFDEQPSPEEVKAYIENRDKQEQVLNEIKPVTNADGTKLISFGQDKTFDTDRTKDLFGAYEQMIVTIKDDEHVITRQEKEDYLIACLNDELFTMDFDMIGGFKLTCRDLNMYENEVASQVVLNYAKTHVNIVPQNLFNLMRQCRIPMQLMRVNGKPYDNISFKYDPDNASDEQLQKDAEYLYKKSRQLEMNTPYARYQLYMKALNVFENKLKKLEAAAFNGNFWKPADQDS